MRYLPVTNSIRRVGRRRPASGVGIGLLMILVLIGGCSSDDSDGDASDPTVAVTDSPDDADATDGASGDGADVGAGDDADADDAATTTVATTMQPDDDPAEPTLPEIGVPGLDDDEVVCRAWSRFAGSFQVAAVAAAFGDDPIGTAVLEVAAAPVVAAAVPEMFEAWPDELASEADLVADRYVGPFARRSARALDELLAAGADDDQLARLAEAWLDALAARDPTEVLPDLILDDDLADLVEAAAVAFAAQVVPIPLDPSLVTDVEIPLTQEFLFETCPDRGTLAGGEIID